MALEQDLQVTHDDLDLDLQLDSVSELRSGHVYTRTIYNQTLPYWYMQLAVVRVHGRWLGFIGGTWASPDMPQKDLYLDTVSGDFGNSYGLRGAYVNTPKIHEVVEFDSLEYLTENDWEIAGTINTIKQGQLQEFWEDNKSDIEYRVEFSKGYVEGAGDESATAQVERLHQKLKLAYKDNWDWQKSYVELEQKAADLANKLRKAEEKINYLNKKYEDDREHDVSVSVTFEFKIPTEK